MHSNNLKAATRGRSLDAESQILEVRVRNVVCDSELKFVSND